MTDADIRAAFHRKELRKYHKNPNSLVVDELGMLHGKCRADIAVVGQRLIGYEIKSDSDSLRRLERQVPSYGDVFDRISLVVGQRHVDEAEQMIPKWWGTIVAREGVNGAVQFETTRRAKPNPDIDTYSVLQLLWRGELIDILQSLGMTDRFDRQNRAVLCETVAASMRPEEARRAVRVKLRQRRDWRNRRNRQ